MNVALLSQPQRELRAYLQRVAGDGGIVETPGEASTFIRRLRSAGVLGSTVLAGVAGGVKAGTLYSIIGPDLDVTRGTVKNRVNRAGVLSEVASGVPATDFAGGVLRGTTVEPSAQNLLPYASDFVTDATGFTINVQTELTTDPIVGTCTRITESVSSTLQRLRISNPLYQGTNRMVTVWVKPEVDTRYFLISSLGASVDPIGPDSNRRIGVIFDLQEMTFTARSSISVIPYIEQRAGGWYKLTAVNVNDSDTTNGNRGWGVGFVNSPTNANTSYAGTGRQALIAFGGAFQGGPIAPTSEILTTGSAQTRNADVISKTGLGSVLPQTEGWVYAEVDVTRFIAGATRPILYFDDGTARRGILLTSLNRLAFRNAEFQITETGKYKVLARHTSGFASFDLFVNGILRTSNSLTATGVNTSIGLGVRQVDNDQFFNDPIHSYAIGSGPITDAQAIQLTTL
jgi:hypothetical protein